MASNLDWGSDEESGSGAGTFAGSAVVGTNGARCAGATAVLGRRRRSATHIDPTMLVADGCRPAH